MIATDLAKLPVHPFADEFPYLSDDEEMALAHDIMENGLHYPVVLHEGAVLDGRNRIRAVVNFAPHLDIPTEEYAGDDPIGWIISSNLLRRHLTVGQKALLALALLEYEELRAWERMTAGVADPTLNYAEGEATAIAGKRLGVSRESVKRARDLATSVAPGAAEALAKVRRGEWSLNQGLEAVEPKTPNRVVDYVDEDRFGNPRLGTVVAGPTTDALVDKLVSLAADVLDAFNTTIVIANRRLLARGARKAMETLSKIEFEEVSN